MKRGEHELLDALRDPDDGLSAFLIVLFGVLALYGALFLMVYLGV